MTDVAFQNGAPRVAVTGYYANVGFRQLGFSSSGKQSLREAFQNFLRDQGLPTHPNSSLEPTSVFDAELCAAGLRQDDSWTVPAESVAVVGGTSKFQSLLEPSPASLEDIFRGHGWPATSDVAGRMLAKWFKVAGPVLTPVAACATGAHSIALGAQMIRWGHVEVALSGTHEGPVPPFLMAGYRQLGALSKSGVMRPFDKKRDGFVPNEGGGILILENEEKVCARGAKIYGYVTGWDMGADATSLTGMDESGASIARAIERALKRAGNPDVEYINAHGTATALNDEVESRGIKSVFGRSVPLSSTKPLTGHLLGAAGAVEAVISLQALREQWAPPTLNLDEPDESCDLDYISDGNSCGRALPMRTVLSLNYGFGGHIGVLVLQKGDD